MATQNCPGIAQVNIIMSDDAQEIQNVFHVDNTTGALWTLADLEVLVDTFHAWWVSQMKPALPNTTALVEVKATDLTSLAGQIFQRPADAGDVGESPEQPLPNNVTAAVKMVVATRGRGAAGRMYWPQMKVGDIVDGSFLTGAFEAVAISALEDLVGRLAAALPDVILSVLSRWLNRIKRVEGIGKPIVRFAFSDNSVDSQRDRLPGHKKHKKHIVV